MDLLVFADPPAAGRFDRNRARERQPDAGVGIGDDILALNDLEQILTGGSEIGGGLRKLYEFDTGARQPLGDGLHLVRIVPYPANAKAPADVKERPPTTRCRRSFSSRYGGRRSDRVHRPSFS